MNAFRNEVTSRIAVWIAEACQQKLSFTNIAQGLLIRPAPEAGGRLAGLLEGPGAFAKGPSHR